VTLIVYILYLGDHKGAGGDRIKKIFEWLDLDAKDRPELLMIYYGFVDSRGHSSGPDSSQV